MNKNHRLKKLYLGFAALVISAAMIFTGCSVGIHIPIGEDDNSQIEAVKTFTAPDRNDEIPYYSGSPYSIINNNEPYFEDSDFTEESFESYSPLDSLGRCTLAFANVSEDTMPTEDRGSISQVKPSGWQSTKYDNVDGGYLYNRCHLIGWQLTSENANEENLITGTRYLNVTGMLPFENMVADYIKETGNHVLYRVTPIFFDDDLVAYGARMEAKSVEDEGEGICFHVFCYNVQPGIDIDYSDGSSSLAETEATEGSSQNTYILNTNSHVFHLPGCSSVNSMSDSNKEEYKGSREDLIEDGYKPCSRCNP